MQKVEDINFPIYRKYKNNKRFYKIINRKEFEEVQVIGTKTVVNYVKASILPDYNFINDLIDDYESFAEAINEEEFEGIRGL